MCMLTPEAMATVKAPVLDGGGGGADGIGNVDQCLCWRVALLVAGTLCA